MYYSEYIDHMSEEETDMALCQTSSHDEPELTYEIDEILKAIEVEQSLHDSENKFFE
jgi:hypothetical protein